MRLITLALIAGCGFNSVDNLNSDLAGVDFSGIDLASSSGEDLARAGGDGGGACNTCNCGQPVLLVAVASVNGATSNDGRVLQWGLGSGGTPTSCGKDLTANKTLPKSPTALGWYPPDAVLYGALEGVFLVDAVKDLYRWNYKIPQSGDNPRSLFPLSKDNGQVVGVGYDTTGYNTITQLYILDPKNGTKLFNWDITDAQNSPIVLGSEVPAMVQSPLDPSHIFFVSNGFSTNTDFPAGDIAAPYDGMLVKPTIYWPMRPTGPYLTTINVARFGAIKRTVWLQHTNTPSLADGVYYVNDDGTGPVLTGPLSCTLPSCIAPFKASDAVPDPTAANRVITTCDSPMSNLTHVVRIDDSGTCTLIVDGNKLANLTYPVALAIAEAR